MINRTNWCISCEMEVLMAVSVQNTAWWDVTPCGLTEACKGSGEI
jgi:hypothetical protein